jgi:hypothetical protein
MNYSYQTHTTPTTAVAAWLPPLQESGWSDNVATATAATAATADGLAPPPVDVTVSDWTHLVDQLHSPSPHYPQDNDAAQEKEISPLSLLAEVSTPHGILGYSYGKATATPLSFLAQVSSIFEPSFGFKGTSLLSALSDISDEIEEAALAPSPSEQVQQHRRRSSRRKGGKKSMKENRESWDRKLTFFKAVKDSYEILSARSNSKSHNKRNSFPPLLKVAYNHVAKSVSKESEDGVFRNYNAFKKWLSNTRYTFSEANKAREQNVRKKNWLYQKLLENEVLSFPPPEPSASIHSQ